MKTLIKCFLGGWFLIKLGWPIKYNLNSEYAKMRLELFYGEPKFRWTWKNIQQMINYGYWAHCMKRDTKNEV